MAWQSHIGDVMLRSRRASIRTRRLAGEGNRRHVAARANAPLDLALACTGMDDPGDRADHRHAEPPRARRNRDAVCDGVRRGSSYRGRRASFGRAVRHARARRAVTVIEVALIISVMAGHADKAGLARDTVFAAAMIVCNGIVGLCLRVGGWRHYEQGFQLQGAGAALGVLAALTTLTMILPNVTTTVQGPVFSTPQLLFVAVVSLLLYGSFLFVQTVRHRDYFLSSETEEEAIHGEPPSASAAWASTGLLVVALVAVVALAKTLTPLGRCRPGVASNPSLIQRHRHRHAGLAAGGAGRAEGRARTDCRQASISHWDRRLRLSA